MSHPGLDRRQFALGGGALTLSSLSPTLSGAASPVGLIDPSGWKLTLEDRFERFDRGVGFDDRKRRWRTMFGYGGPDALDNRTLTGNAEEQVYVDPEFRGLGLDPFRLTSRGLAIVADRTPPQARAKLWDKPFTSGLITTRLSFSQLYGYFEVRARLPRGKGLWPAFWLAPADGSWPPELDIMEFLAGDTTTYYATVHIKGQKSQSHVVKPGFDLTDGVHAFGASWSPEEIVWYLDRREVARQPTPPSMNKPMYILANLAVGGRWGGPPGLLTKFPAVYEIEAIRAWKLPA